MDTWKCQEARTAKARALRWKPAFSLGGERKHKWLQNSTQKSELGKEVPEKGRRQHIQMLQAMERNLGVILSAMEVSLGFLEQDRNPTSTFKKIMLHLLLLMEWVAGSHGGTEIRRAFQCLSHMLSVGSLGGGEAWDMNRCKIHVGSGVNKTGLWVWQIKSYPVWCLSLPKLR